jgi:hypothetical protein
MSALKAVVIAATGLSLLIAARTTAAEDLTVVSKESGSRGAGGTSTLYISATKIRLSDPSHDTIFDGASGKMAVIDRQKKVYWESSAEEREAAFRQLEEQMKKMQEQLANLPPAIREKMAGATGAAGASITVQKGTGTKKIAGYDCEQYLISMGETIKIEKWVTQDLQFPLTLFDAQKATFAGNPMLKNFARMADEMKKIKGFPLGETTTIKGAPGVAGETSREATEVKKGAIDASVFAIPAGYAKVESPLARMTAGKK